MNLAVLEGLDYQRICFVLLIIVAALIICLALRTVKRVAATILGASILIVGTSGCNGLTNGVFPNLFNNDIDSSISSAVSDTVTNIKDSISSAKQSIHDFDDTQSKNQVTDSASLIKRLPVVTSLPDDAVRVHYINVGQADCELIDDNGHYALIDCGNSDDDCIVIPYLEGLGVEKLDYFVASHPHEDHIGCAASVLENFDCENVIVPDVSNDTVCYNKMLETIAEKGYNIITVNSQILGTLYPLGKGTFKMMGPIAIDENNLNNDSVVIQYRLGAASFLFQGDAEREEEASILEAGYDVQSTVYKVGHHGSDTSTSYPWLNAIMPQFAVICVDSLSNLGQQYGHPSENVISKLMDADVMQVYRTDINGTVVVSTDGSSIMVDTEK